VTRSLFVFCIGLVVGFINGFAGGAAILSFPAMIAIGLNPVAAAMTNALGVWVANIGALHGKFREAKLIILNEKRLISYSIFGALFGGLSLALIPLNSFQKLIPILIAVSSLSLIYKQGNKLKPISIKFENLLLSVVGFYAGYFGPGQGIMTIAILARNTKRSLIDINIRKNIIVSLTCVGPNIIYLASGKVNLYLALILSCGSVIGGYFGGKVIGRFDPQKYRLGIFVIGISTSIWFALKYWS
jgi:uncharacterized membrane protein YfcA